MKGCGYQLVTCRAGGYCVRNSRNGARIGGSNTASAVIRLPISNSTEAEKRTNRKLAQIRVQVEHDLAGVKRCRIVKDVLRNTKDGVSDAVMEAACGLHNVRDENPKRRLKS